MAAAQIYQCIICGLEAKDRPPRHCPRCGAPASRWRLVVDRPPMPPPPSKPEGAAAEGAAAERAAAEGAAAERAAASA